MKIFCIKFTIFFLLLAGLKIQASTTSLASNSVKKIVILGDSLTEGYGVAQSAAFPALLQNKINADQLNWKVISSGSSGSTSASGLQRIKWIAKDKPDIVLLLLGSNDGLRGLKIEETQKNLNDTIVWGIKNSITMVLGQLYVPPNYGKDYEKKFSEIYKKVATENKIQLAPFILDKVAGNKDLNLADGIHPNEKGHQIVAENLYPFIKKLISKK